MTKMRNFDFENGSTGQRMDGNGAILFYIERPTNLGFFISII